MPLTPEQTTRIDQLHAHLRRVAKDNKPRAGVPSDAPMFTRHEDGSVYDRQGRKIHEPPAAGK
jgi:hypothetical protein